MTPAYDKWSPWTRFWHQPVRAERLALMRILLALALLSDQLLQYLPNLEEFFGPTGVAPQGLHDWYQLKTWRWPIFFFYTDDPWVVKPLFGLWVAVTFFWLIGLQSRCMNVAVWLLTHAFICRNPDLSNGGDDTLQVGVFLLMLMPAGRALSLDAWLRHRRTGTTGPDYTPAWPVRVLQIQLCIIYMTTGLAKLVGTGWVKLNAPAWMGTIWWREGCWWDGTALHYALNDPTMIRWSFTQFPLPVWLTTAMTFTCVWWETLFSFLVLSRRTRWLALLFGIGMHLGIWLTLEIGWFSWYTLSFYGVWVPCVFWERWFPGGAAKQKVSENQVRPPARAMPAATGLAAPLPVPVAKA